MNKVKWTQVLVFGIVALVVFLVGLTLLPMFFDGGYWGVMGPNMMGGWCPWCGGTGRSASSGLVGGLFTLLGLLIPIGVLGLLVLGGVWLVRNMSGTTAPSSPSATCPDCSQPVAADWRNCPYCGKELR